MQHTHEKQLAPRSFLPIFVWQPGYCSDEDDVPGSPCVSPPLVAMAMVYFPIFLLLLFLSSFTLFLVTFLPSTSSISSTWSSPSCGPGHSWAVRLHKGSHEQEDDEYVSVHLDVIASKVGWLIHIVLLFLFCSTLQHLLRSKFRFLVLNAPILYLVLSAVSAKLYLISLNLHTVVEGYNIVF